MSDKCQYKVVIDPNSNLPYGSFYINGLIALFGKNNVRFSKKPFSGLCEVGWNLRFVIEKKDNTKPIQIIKYFIHTSDTYHIDINNYDWCDVYGNVNANFTYYPKSDYPKQVALFPSFAISNFTLFETTYYSITNLLKGFHGVSNNKFYSVTNQKFERKFFRNIKRHFFSYFKNYFFRVPIQKYNNHKRTKFNYIFFLSTLWYSDEYNKNDSGLNLRRANFIRACRDLKEIIFEGGLLADNGSSTELFKDCVVYQKVKIQKWIDKTKDSLVVFNTPAFWDCHGWKLGEYFALKKAIISTPLSNDLPSPLIHGEHIHIVKESSLEAFKEAVVYLYSHPDYRAKLEKNTEIYWEKYGSPHKSLEILFSHYEMINKNATKL